MLELCGFRLLLECPIDLSAIDVFTPITAVGQIDPLGFICAEPWYKAAKYLHLWNVSLIDAVLISTPAGVLGLPFLTRNPKFSAKIYATEATMKIGRLMMDDLVSMHAEYAQFYGHGNTNFPEWMGWDELERLPVKLREAAIGEDAEELGCWLSLYSRNRCLHGEDPGSEIC